MLKTDNFFVVSNYNVDPSPLVKFAHDYIVYDQSDKPEIVQLNASRSDPRIIPHNNTGHNHIVFFKYIIDNYQNLPPVVSFLKGNIIGRHVTQSYWDRNFDNKHYTFLWDDPSFQDKPGIAYSLYSGHFLELNNSWFVPNSKHRYFTNLNQLLSFFYEINKFPRFNLFAPGGCYIVERQRILRNPVSFYQGLVRIMDYDFFPSEVWMVERIMNIIFDSDWPLKSYVYNQPELFQRIDELDDLTEWQPIMKRRSRLRNSLVYRGSVLIESLKS